MLVPGPDAEWWTSGPPPGAFMRWVGACPEAWPGAVLWSMEPWFGAVQAVSVAAAVVIARYLDTRFIVVLRLSLGPA